MPALAKGWQHVASLPSGNTDRIATIGSLRRQLEVFSFLAANLLVALEGLPLILQAEPGLQG